MKKFRGVFIKNEREIALLRKANGITAAILDELVANVRPGVPTMLFEDMRAEYEKGNYCVCGGDFNHDFTGNSTQVLNGGEMTEYGWAQPFPEELLPEGIRRCTDYEGDELQPTCRNCDEPYKEGNFTIIVDGFLVSDNVTVSRTENVQTGFEYSDHNPVALDFILN